MARAFASSGCRNARCITGISPWCLWARTTLAEDLPVAACRRLGLIGCGRIGRPIVEAWRDGTLAGWRLDGILARGTRGVCGLRPCADADTFFASAFDLIVEAAGPPALAAHGVRALGAADVWSVSAAALADPVLFRALEAAGRRAGHRLRLVAGAIAGLDGVAMASVDPAAVLRLDVDLSPGPGTRSRIFEGTVREAALRHPDSVNVAAAAALAGPGFERSRIELSHPGPVARHRLALTVDSRHAFVEAAVEPRLGAACHPVAACLIANLRRELQTVWAG